MIPRMLLTMMICNCKSQQQQQRIRVIKTLFFLVSMLISFLIFSAPVLLALADSLLPASLLCIISINPNSDQVFFSSYDFTHSLVDVPLISLIRSSIIVFVYSLCDGARLSSGPYLGITAICSLSSLVFVVVKAYYFFHSARRLSGLRAMEVALFVCSAVLAVSHIVVAYRVNRRERRKLLVYKIDIEAVVSKNGFPTRYSKLLQLEERTQ